jgi:hypothetical protein
MSEIMEEMKEITREIRAISHKLDILMEERELYGMMRISEPSLSPFLIDEPDIYTISYCKVVYR